MTDDNNNDAQPREPRSPVEAAADPAHGGGMSFSRNTNDAMPSPVSVQGSAQPQRTILSGVDRIFAAMENGVDVAAELDSLVGTLAGDAKSAAAEVERATDSTVAQVHSAADAVEALFGRMADLVKRAKAAHG